MARKPEEEARIQGLILQAEMARRHLGTEAVKLRKKLDVPARVRSSFSGHPARWMAGSLFSGMATSLLLRRKPKRATSSKSKGAVLAVLAMLTAAAKPLVKAWLISRLKDMLARSQPRFPQTHPVARPLP